MNTQVLSNISIIEKITVGKKGNYTSIQQAIEEGIFIYEDSKPTIIDCKIHSESILCTNESKNMKL